MTNEEISRFELKIGVHSTTESEINTLSLEEIINDAKECIMADCFADYINNVPMFDSKIQDADNSRMQFIRDQIHNEFHLVIDDSIKINHETTIDIYMFKNYPWNYRINYNNETKCFTTNGFVSQNYRDHFS